MCGSVHVCVCVFVYMASRVHNEKEESVEPPYVYLFQVKTKSHFLFKVELEFILIYS